MTSSIISAPTGDVVPAKVTEQPSGDYQFEYFTKFTGKSTIIYYYCYYYAGLVFTIGNGEDLFLSLLLFFFLSFFLSFFLLSQTKFSGRT